MPPITVMVGGAVLTETLAKEIGADYYAPDAMASIRIAKEGTRQTLRDKKFGGKQGLPSSCGWVYTGLGHIRC